jgi:hypothetical protein
MQAYPDDRPGQTGRATRRSDHPTPPVFPRQVTNGTESQRALAQVDANERFTALVFVGVGHLTTGDAYLAAEAAARARENRQLARDARYDCHNRARDEECGAPEDQSIAA